MLTIGAIVWNVQNLPQGIKFLKPAACSRISEL